MSKKVPVLSFGKALWLPFLGWTMVLAILLAWNVWHETEHTKKVVYNVARATLQKDLALRSWATAHGGVYVPVNDRTQPNPYLKDIPERDIQTPSGKQLTLMNPAYLLRQLLAEHPGLYGVREHVTSLKPLNPDNAPDTWERAALEAFEQGTREIKGVVSSDDGERSYRVMLPLKVEEGCLKCHRHQGYKVGDIRGGISTTVPMRLYEGWQNETIGLMLMSHGLIWFLGLIIIASMVGRNLERVRERNLHARLLEQSESKYRRLLNFANDAVFLIDADTSLIVEANQMATVLLGLPMERIVGLHQAQFHPMNMSIDYRKSYEGLIKSGHKIVTESVVLHQRGHTIPVEIHAGVVELKDKKRIIQATYLDISDHKRRELILTEREAHLHAILDNALDAIITIDAEGRIVEFNPAAETLFGYSTDEIVGKEMALLIVPPEFRQLHRAALERLMSKNMLRDTFKRSVEFPGLRKDGQQVDLELSIISSSREGKSYYTAFVHDITDRKQLLRSLRDTLEVAESANRAKSAFLANMSHEIRTPMNAIIGMTDLVLTTQLTPEEQRYNLEIVQQSSATLLSLINSILDISKIEAGKLTLESIAFDLREQIEGVCERLAVAAHRKGLELCYQVSDDAPKSLRGDPLRLQQIITNLVNNATKFTEEGEIVLRVQRLPSDGKSAGARLHFTVADTGIGIPPDKISAVFEHFTQVDESVTRKYGGTGLGLTISKYLVEMMGGDIWIESTLGQGSTFHLTIPFDINQEQADTERQPSPPLAGVRVLIGDGNSTSREIQQDVVVAFGAMVSVANDGASLLASLQRAQETQRPYDLLLLDQRLLHESPPDPEVMRAHPGWHGRAVVMLPTQAGLNSLAHLSWLRDALPIKKPPQRSKLLQVLGVALGREYVDPNAKARESFKIRRSPLSLHILLVEDQVTNQLLADTILKRAGHLVTIANHGQEALSLMKEVSFDVVLMDLHMPIMGGIEAAERIRQATAGQICHPQVPIIAITAKASAGDERACLDAGMNGFISKPYRAAELIEALEPFIKKRAVAADQQPSAAKVTILKPVASDPETLARDVEIFIAATPQRLQNLARYLKNKDVIQAEKESKGLRTAAENIGAIRVVTGAMRFRGSMETLDWAEADKLLQTLEEECQKVFQALRDQRGGLS
ncbi:MAG: PAS domain S-box protein [Magnetococcales bacterium]|nr:PAS domain S-box protein [Magnetococcales bacterium]